jgi:cytochrome c1
MKTFGRARLVDDVIDAYVAWREECRFVCDAYRRWSKAPPADATLAFAAYAAALDREERASAFYARRLSRLAR